MKAGKVLLALGLVLVGLVVVVAYVAAPVGGKTGIDRDSPPAPGPSTTSSYTPPYTPPTQTYTSTHACSWDWKGGRFTVELWHDGSRVRRWSLPLALTSGGGSWGLKGDVEFNVDSCGGTFDYVVVVYATAIYEGSVESPLPTNTSTWAPPNIQPPNRPPIVPLSVLEEGMSFELYKHAGESNGAVRLSWSGSLDNVFSMLPDGKYVIKVWCEIDYIAPGHVMKKYSDAVDLGTFKVVGGKVSYEG